MRTKTKINNLIECNDSLRFQVKELKKIVFDLRSDFENQERARFIKEATRRNYFNKDYCFNYFFYYVWNEEPKLVEGFVRYDDTYSHIEDNFRYNKDKDEFWIPVFLYSFKFPGPVLGGLVCIYRKGIWAPIIKIKELEEKSKEDYYKTKNIKFNYIYGK
jgi:hypothetical protein